LGGVIYTAQKEEKREKSKVSSTTTNYGGMKVEEEEALLELVKRIEGTRSIRATQREG